MSSPVIRISLDSTQAHYHPGERLSGRYVGEGSQADAARAVELSVLWYTAGKGDEDFSVHHFERVVDDLAKPLDLRMPQRFATELPPSPLSYDGEIVKVCWCVRIRLFLPQGQEVVAEIPFQLGDVPAPVAATPDETEPK